MKTKGKLEKPGRGIWLIGLAIAFVVHAIGLWVFQVKEEELPVEPERTYVSLPSTTNQSHHGNLLREQAHLFDSSPLFLPTRWNAASSPVVRELEQRPGELFDSFPARLSYGERDFGLGTIVQVAPQSPLRSLRAFGDRTHTVFGRGPVEGPVLAERFALFEVWRPASGEVVLQVKVSGEGAPVVQSRLWNPVEFLIQVESVGLIGQPVLLRGSGVEEVNQFLRAALDRLLSEQMLPVGYYRIVGGP